MPAYAVFTRETTTNAAELEAYMQKVGPTLEGHPVTLRAVYGQHEVLEGPPVEGVVILEFPTFSDAKKWYDSPLYQAVAKHRFNGSTSRAVIVEGVPGK